MNAARATRYAAPARGGSANRLSPAGLVFVVVVHAVVFHALLSMNVIRLPVQLPVLSIDLLVPPAPEPQPEPPRPEIVPPKPRPVATAPTPRPVELPPLALPQLALPADAPVAAPAVEIPMVIAPSPVPPAPAPAPAAPSQPRFDADYLDNPKPVYPYASRKLKEEGRVLLRVQVAASGLPTDVTVHASSGHARLDQIALETVRRWKFIPARLGSDAVAASVLVPIDFSLKN